MSFVWKPCPAAPLALFCAVVLAPAVYAQAPATPPPAAAPATAPPVAAPQTSFPDAPSQTSTLRPPPVPTGPTVVMDTSKGRLTCKLFDKESPLAASNFIGLAEGTKEWQDPTTKATVKGKPFFSGTTFHRVIPGFMIQGGDRTGTGMGDAGYFFDNETTPGLTFDVAGRLAMANAGPNTNGTQFFVTELPQPELDGKYTIFGQCDAHSVLIVATIARVDRNSSDKPLTPVTLDKVTIVRDGQPMPPEPLAPAPAAPPATTTAPALSPLAPAKPR